MGTADYSLEFNEKSITKAFCWTFSENICNSSLFQKKSSRYSVINIDKISKKVLLELENKPKNKFLITVRKIITIFFSIIFLGIPLLFDYMIFKIAKNKCDKFRKTYKVTQAINDLITAKIKTDITKKVNDIENNLSFNTLNLMYLMLNHINNNDPSAVNKSMNSSSDIIDFLVKNADTFKNLKKLQKSDVKVTLGSISILSKFLPNLEVIDFSNASYPDFGNNESLDLTKFKNLKTLKLHFKEKFPKLTPSNFKLDGVKGLTIDLTDNDKLKSLAALKWFINPMIFKNCKNVTILISPLVNHSGNQTTEDEIQQIYHKILNTSDSVTFKIIEKK